MFFFFPGFMVFGLGGRVGLVLGIINLIFAGLMLFFGYYSGLMMLVIFGYIVGGMGLVMLLTSFIGHEKVDNTSQEI